MLYWVSDIFWKIGNSIVKSISDLNTEGIAVWEVEEMRSLLLCVFATLREIKKDVGERTS
ncbi:hypothetical protein [Aphanizomenon sp. UHCC 0183]|uniref:hypothetical protein n=1 Tax=Aphanizomenon sp. UHCC 0183 TaxID=2590028 RepID=UPI000AC27CDC|nr:hypothetical protein [Aphanizomenon sp. UHCC 0183]